MKEITHKILWSARTEKEHDLVLKECERVASIGGSFHIENHYVDDWYSFITIYYPKEANP